VQVALVLFPGVSADECEAFTMVFEQLTGIELLRVGHAVGPVAGPGGGQFVDTPFGEVAQPDIVVVPGGLGCARTAEDPELLAWLRTVVVHCDWMVASSTGSVVLAAAGLLGDREAATHWLAAPLLESYGSAASPDRVVEDGNIITCEGQITAMHVALLVTLRVAGPVAVSDVRTALMQSSASNPDSSTRWQRWRTSRVRAAPGRPRNPELIAPHVIEFDPITPRRTDVAPRSRID
jgi:transcriptional regulator GlxA family with amidase domain